MHSGYWLISTLAIPLFSAVLILSLPDRQKNAVRWISALSGAALLAISVYIFFAYETNKGGGYQFFIRWDWLQNVAFLGPHGIALAFGIDGIAAPMILLTGMVAFGGALISWKIEHHNKDFFVLFWVLVGRRVRHLRVARPLLLLLLLRSRGAADVPAHRRVGIEQRI